MQKGKPPLYSRFQKGRSGNPGRPSQRYDPGPDHEPGVETSVSSGTGGWQGVPDNDIRGRDPQSGGERQKKFLSELLAIFTRNGLR